MGRQTHGDHDEGIYGIQMFTIRREQDRLAEVAPVPMFATVQDSAVPCPENAAVGGVMLLTTRFGKGCSVTIVGAGATV